jgi:hypothetical protein
MTGTELREGQIIEGLRGRFQIKRRCGEGGFGLTFEGVDAQGRAVAVKQLRFEKLRDWKALELFEREGRVLEQLSHPNIPAYVDFFAHDGQRPMPAAEAAKAGGAVSWFLVQQFVQGPSLQQVMSGQQRLGGAQLENIVGSLLLTLDYLHRLHPPVIHRDINPKNIVLSPEGRPYLVDFGAIQDRLRFENQQGSTSVGTLGYMPLEQLRGAARPSSDLYALGMTALALASGRSPSEMPVDEDTGKVAIAQVAPGLSPPMRAVLDRMIEPIVGQRISSAGEALALLRGDAPRRPPKGAPRPRALPVVVAATLVLVTAGGGVAMLTLRASPTPPRPRYMEVPVATEVSRDPLRAPAVQPATPPTVRAVEPTPEPTPPRPFALRWKARVAASSGKALAGASCEVSVEGSIQNEKFARPRVVARCGNETLYDSQAQLNGTSMNSWDLKESPVPGKVGAFSYRLVYSDVGTRTGERAQATVDSGERQGIFFRETLPLYRVVLALDPASTDRTGEPLLAENRPVFRKVIERKGKVLEVSGKSPVASGASCQFVLSPAKATRHTCRAQLTCGGKKLYGALPTNGYAACDLEEGEPTGFSDAGSDKDGGDPETVVNLKTGTLELKERRGEPFSLKVELSGAPPDPLGHRR